MTVPDKPKQSSFLVYFSLAVLVTIIWGFNFAVAGRAVTEIPPFLLVALRYLTVFAIFAPFTSPKGLPWRTVVLVGVFYGVIQFSGLFLGLRLGVSAGIASTIIQSQAFFTILLAIIFLGDRFKPLQWIGLVISAGGLAVVSASKDGSAPIEGVLCILAGGLGWALSNIVLKKAGSVSAWRLNIWQSVVVIPIMLIASTLLEVHQVDTLSNISWSAAGAVLYIALLATGFGNFMWYKVVQEIGPASVAPISLLIPVFGILGGIVLLGEALSNVQMIGILLIILGLTTIQLPQLKILITRVSSI